MINIHLTPVKLRGLKARFLGEWNNTASNAPKTSLNKSPISADRPTCTCITSIPAPNKSDVSKTMKSCRLKEKIVNQFV